VAAGSGRAPFAAGPWSQRGAALVTRFLSRERSGAARVTRFLSRERSGAARVTRFLSR
jgi:hypothetical protein